MYKGLYAALDRAKASDKACTEARVTMILVHAKHAPLNKVGSSNIMEAVQMYQELIKQNNVAWLEVNKILGI